MTPFVTSISSLLMCHSWLVTHDHSRSDLVSAVCTGGRFNLEELSNMTTELEVGMVSSGVCIGHRIVRVDSATEAGNVSRALAELHNETQRKVRDLEAMKQEIEQAIAALKQNVYQEGTSLGTCT